VNEDYSMKMLIGKYGWSVGLGIFAIGFLISCSTVPQTGRSSLNLVGSGQETQLGLQAFEEIKKQEKISTNPELNAMLQRVGKRIAAVADPDIPDSQWEFILFENKTPNAFALPGGKVGVHTGILEITKNEAGLATVLSHEVGHVAAHHARERMSQNVLASVGAAGLSIGLSKKDPRTQQLALMAFGAGSTLGVLLPYSRLHESEADRIGLIYMAKAGYNPEEAVAFWERFRDYNRKQGGRPPVFLSTHPTDEKRIEDLRNYLPEARVYYKTSGRR
jgi:metalloendopeptidase OMA1, mitochondrial